MFAQPKRTVWPLAALAAVVVSGCTFNPIATAPRSMPAPQAMQPQTGAITGASLPSGIPGTATGAEQACIAAGRDRGLDVLGVVGARTADDLSRDVILRVQRSGSVIEVRCNYVTSTQTARIMLI